MAGFDIAPYGQAIASASDLLNGILKRVLPEKMSESEKANLQQQVTLELMKADWGGVIGQLEINKIEAASPSRFVSGWRPYIGWVCGTALGYATMGQPFIGYAVQIAYWLTRAAAGTPFPTAPVIDVSSLVTLLLGLLGLGGLRTFEKIKGVARS